MKRKASLLEIVSTLCKVTANYYFIQHVQVSQVFLAKIVAVSGRLLEITMIGVQNSAVVICFMYRQTHK